MGRRQGHGRVSVAPITDALQTLMDALSDAEREQFVSTGTQWLYVVGSKGGRYRLYPQGQIVQLSETGGAMREICAHLPYGAHTHPALNVLAVKLLIQSDEPRFRNLRYGDIFNPVEAAHPLIARPAPGGATYAYVVHDEVREQPRTDVPF